MARARSRVARRIACLSALGAAPPLLLTTLQSIAPELAAALFVYALLLWPTQLMMLNAAGCGGSSWLCLAGVLGISVLFNMLVYVIVGSIVWWIAVDLIRGRLLRR